MFIIFVNKIIDFIKEIFLYFFEGLRVIFCALKSKVAFVFYAMIFVYFFADLMTLKNNEMSIVKESNRLISEETLDFFNYDLCTGTPLYNNRNISTGVGNMNKYFSETYPNSSILYYDIKTGYKYTYNENKVYFGASLIKTLSALYIYEKALVDESILDKKIIYTESYLKHSAPMMGKKEFGEQVTLRELVNYSISVSDNIAYKMLLEYIGFYNLKSYGYSIGNKHTLEGNDGINGNINLNDALNYMKRLYDYINNNDKLGKELRGYFKNNYALYFEKNPSPILHKSGDWIKAHHDIAIIEDENPYIIIILTNNGQGEKLSIKDISNKIYSFHKLYTDNQKQICDVYKK